MTDTATNNAGTPRRELSTNPVPRENNLIVIQIDDDSSDDGTTTVEKQTTTIPTITPIQNNNNNIETQNIISNQTTSPSNANDASPTEPIFKFGPYVPILRKDNVIIIDHNGIVNDYSETKPTALSKRLTCEVLPGDAIVEAASLVTPLLLKKRTKWPPKEVVGPTIEEVSEKNKSQYDSDTVNNSSQISDSSQDEVQVIKVVNNDPTTAPTVFNNKTVDDYVRSTTVASITNTRIGSTSSSILTVEDYYKTSVGEILIGIGFSQVREFNLNDNVRRLASKIRRGGESISSSLIEELESLRGELLQVKASNKAYKSDQILKCPHCPFKSAFSIALAGHMETPHMNNRREFLCNWCDYKIKDSNQIVFHNLIEHKKRCRIERPVALHSCRYCPYECRSKKKMSTHIERCGKSFSHSVFLGPQDYGENEFPAVTSKLITQQDVKTYESTLRSLRLAAYNPHQIQVSGLQQGIRDHLPVMFVQRQNGASSSNAGMIRPSNIASYVQANQSVVNTPTPVVGNPLISPFGVMKSQTGSAHTTLAQHPNNSAQLLHFLSVHNVNLNQNKAATLQFPRTQSSFVNGKYVMKTASDIVMAPQNQSSGLYNGTSQVMNSNNLDGVDLSLIKERMTQQSAVGGTNSVSISPTSNSKGSTFVICEICDGYIKDLSQLKSHMQLIHKVKIHQKMLESRPPLNCQKCQWRFFTDQGLERHLLGAHGLVTSNMQEQVDHGTDSGRCTVCGRAYADKLVAHMKEVHKSNLKPAHLSYKCTVCSATFNLYRLFENHVYSVHSESVRRIPIN